MNNKLTTRLIWILLIFGLGVYALLPTVQYQFIDKKEATDEKIQDLKSKSIKQGLDLEGGIYIVLEVDLPQLVNSLASNKDKKFEIFLDELSNQYSNNTGDFFTLFEKNVINQDLKLARYFIKYGKTNEEIIAQLKLQSDDSINRVIEIIQNRVDQFGVSEPTIQKQGNDRVIVELAGITDSERARSLLQSTALLELIIVKNPQSTNTIVRQIDSLINTSKNIEEEKTDSENLFNSDIVENDLQFSSLIVNAGNDLGVTPNNLDKLKTILEQESVKKLLDATNSQFLLSNSAETFFNEFDDEEKIYLIYHLNKNAELTGGVIENAQASTATSGIEFGQNIVQIEMNNAGSKEWARITGANINNRIAIVLDKKVHMAPVIKSQIVGGGTVIEGLDSREEAKDLAVVLRAGSLPVPVAIVEERTVGASLGSDSVQQGTYSIIIGLLLVIIFLVIYYRMSGIIASISVIWTLILLLGVLALLEATLTLPGIAGLILTVGMSVDANVIIFERIKEELRKGKTIRSAIDAGYSKAITTIVDANLTTGIAAAVLYQYGSGPIKGFATVLFWGIIISMFTAIIVTRFIFDFVTSQRNINKLSI
tara:strand:- start:86 stop:1873 length:1788 start_codon:yes stop_codon:yes gene_type:complete